MYLAPLNYDRFFKKVFSDEQIAKQFLEDFLEVTITDFKKLEREHKLTDEAAAVEFDFRCKIKGSYVIIDMQQWYKPDIGHRFYLYHALNTGLQLQDLPKKDIITGGSEKEFKTVRDYRLLEPVITLVWMVVDSLKFDNDYVTYAMTPAAAVDFIKDEQLWHNPTIVQLLTERKKILELMANEVKGIDFISKNRLVFMFQQNIIKNKAIKKYERWFEFAEKTRNQDNKEEDFNTYKGDKVFNEIIRRLKKTKLSDSDIVYIRDEKKYWDKYNKLEQGVYEDGKSDGEKIGLRKGREEGRAEGREEGREEEKKEIARKALEEGLPIDLVSKISGITIEEVKKL
ncbi:MAG: hypothetical protein GY757_41370 [bacterium]|nr:hypothetical protein [bacterium]